MSNKRRKGGRVTAKGTRPASHRSPTGSLSARAFEIRDQVERSRDAAADIEVTGTAGGSAVTVTMDGTGHASAVSVDPSAVDLDDLSLLEDLVMLAINDANKQAADARTKAAEQEVGNGIDLKALGLDGLLG